MNKTLKWLLIGVCSLVIISAIVFIIRYVTSARDSQNRTIPVIKNANSEQDDLVVEYIKSVAISLEIFKGATKKLPNTLSEFAILPEYEKIKQEQIVYSKVTDKIFFLCGPYTNKKVDMVSTATTTWTVSKDGVCLLKTLP